MVDRSICRNDADLFCVQSNQAKIIPVKIKKRPASGSIAYGRLIEYVPDEEACDA